MPSTDLVIGLDGGGTNTTLVAARSGQQPDMRLQGAGANRLRHGEERTAKVLAALVREVAAHNPGATRIYVSAGVAGAGDPELRQNLATRIRHLLAGTPLVAMEIVHDGVIALDAAYLGKSGLAIIAGTGSAVYGRTKEGEIVQAGGWGYRIGDEGSGYAIAIGALRAVAHAMDGGPSTTLQARMAQHYNINGRSSLLKHVFREDWPVQRVAPLVLETAAGGDEVARRIVLAEASALLRQAAWLMARCPPIKRRLTLFGGLCRSEYYSNALFDEAKRILPGMRGKHAEESPVMGALHRARALAP